MLLRLPVWAGDAVEAAVAEEEVEVGPVMVAEEVAGQTLDRDIKEPVVWV